MTLPANIRVIDTHVHVWDVSAPWMEWLKGRPADWDSVRRDFTWQDLTTQLDRAGVAEIVLVQACTDPRETKLLLELAHREPRILGVVGWASLKSAHATEVDLASFEGEGFDKLVGIRNHHGWPPEGDILATPAALDSLRLIAERGLALDILTGSQRDLPILLPWCEKIPNGRYVIDHLGRPILDAPDAFPQWADAMTALSRRPNVFVKYSGWATSMGTPRAIDVQRHIDFVLETFGAERVMFASNWPVALVAGSYEDTYLETLKAIQRLPRADFEAVMHGTAERCYLKPLRLRQGIC